MIFKSGNSAGSKSTILSNFRTSRIPRYCCPNHHRFTSIFHSWNQTFRIIGCLGCSPNIYVPWCWEQCERWLIWPYYVFPIIRHPDFMIITPSFSTSSIVFSNQRFSNSSSNAEVVFVKLSSDCFCGKGSSRWFLSSAVNFAAVVILFLGTILFNVWWSLSLSFDIQPLILLADDVFPWFVYAVITLETAALLDTPNKVANLVTDSPAKRAPTICPPWKSDKSPILQYFHTNCY